ncbi:metallophosphoesterase [uncultured Clostridium sp.]|uniref:metallophosphoesterase n=1 Tax=uncultured Clostridium sp. TaxID=59620 RepID=UPI00260DB290|nr:metallophosphoesterase [uncultured Clostridium sp.]
MRERGILKLFSQTEKLSIDRDSKIVFLSDAHRGDGGRRDTLIGNRNIYISALKYYYKEEYTLVEIGDGDELWKNKNMINISYNYKEVFRILNRFRVKKKLYMLYGNHDIKKRNKNFAETQNKAFKKIKKNFGEECLELINNTEFLEGIVLDYKPYNKEILVMHGHQMDLWNNELWMVSRFLVRHLWKYLEGVAGFKEPITPANNYNKGGMIDKRLNDFANKNKKMIVCGHTHDAVFPDVGEGLYFNDGCCVNPQEITTIEINKGVIALIKWSIEINEGNFLYIKRNVIKGPERLEDYLEFVK